MSFILSAFPPDVIERLCEKVCSLNAHDLMHLWLTGNSILQRKLSCSVTRFCLDYLAHRPIVWPNIIARFVNLRRLKLTTPATSLDHEVFNLHSFDYSLSVQNVQLENLPPTLRSLKIISFNAIRMFIADNPKQDATFVLGRHLPNLKVLHLDGWSYGKSVRLLLHQLPTNLQKLTLNVDLPSSEIALLPETLEYLCMRSIIVKKTVHESSDAVSIIQGWPINLSTLKIYAITTESLQLDSLSQNNLILALRHLPSSLKNFTFTYPRIDESSMNHFCANLDLESLSVYGSFEFYWNASRLFKRLPTKLALASDFGSTFYLPTMHDLKILSPSMTKLTILNDLHISWSDLSVKNSDIHLPTSLTKLIIVINEMPSLSSISLGNLKHLYFLSIGVKLNHREPLEVSEYFLDNLPSSLTQLALPMLYTRQFLRLPSSLKILHLKQACRFGGGRIEWAYLPRLTAISVSLVDSTIEPNDFLVSLPKTIKTLAITDYRWTDDCAKNLPQQLDSLILSHVWGPSTLNCQHRLTNQFLRELPKSLKKLELTYDNDFTNEGISLLPSLLTNLYFGSKTLMTCEGLTHLPRYLLSLSLMQQDDLDFKNVTLHFLSNLMTIKLYIGTGDANEFKSKLPPYWKNFVYKTENFSGCFVNHEL